MGLIDKAREAREIADRSIDAFDHAKANALEGAVHAEARQAVRDAERRYVCIRCGDAVTGSGPDPEFCEDCTPPPFPDPPVQNIRIDRPQVLN